MEIILILLQILSGNLFTQNILNDTQIKTQIVLEKSYKKYDLENKERTEGCFSTDFLSPDNGYTVSTYSCFSGREYFVIFDLINKKWYRIWDWQLNNK